MSYAILLLLALPFAAEHPTETDADRKPRLQVDGNALIRGATIHTAVGPAFEGDVLVQDGRIAAVGRVTAQDHIGKRVLQIPLHRAL